MTSLPTISTERQPIRYSIYRGKRSGMFNAVCVLPNGTVSSGMKHTADDAVAALRELVPACYQLTLDGQFSRRYL